MTGGSHDPVTVTPGLKNLLADDFATKMVPCRVRQTPPMPSLTIKDIPDEVLAKLRARAAADRRSMSKEAIHLLDIALSADLEDEPARMRAQARAQVEAWSRLSGRWQSDLDAGAEIDAIYAARSRGRSVEL